MKDNHADRHLSYVPAISTGLGITAEFWLIISIAAAAIHSIYEMWQMLVSDGEGGFNSGNITKANIAILLATIMRLIPAAALFGIAYLFR